MMYQGDRRDEKQILTPAYLLQNFGRPVIRRNERQIGPQPSTNYRNMPLFSTPPNVLPNFGKIVTSAHESSQGRPRRSSSAARRNSQSDVSTPPRSGQRGRGGRRSSSAVRHDSQTGLHRFHGTIIHVNQAKRMGFIQPSEIVPQTTGNLYFSFNSAKKISPENLIKGYSVSFIAKANDNNVTAVDVWPGDSSGADDNALSPRKQYEPEGQTAVVDVAEDVKRNSVYDRRSGVANQHRATINTASTVYTYQIPGAYCYGRIANVKDKFAFIRPDATGNEKPDDIYMNKHSVHTAGMDLHWGDVVKYAVVKRKEKFEAGKVIVEEFKPRSEIDIVLFIDQAVRKCVMVNGDEVGSIGSVEESEYSDIQAVDANVSQVNSERLTSRYGGYAFLIELMNCTALWKCLGSTNDISTATVLRLLGFVLKIEGMTRGMRRTFANALNALLESRLFNAWCGNMRNIVRELWINGSSDDMDIVQDFFSLAFKYCPERSRTIVSLIKPMVDSMVCFNSRNTQFLYSALKEVCKLSGECTASMEWSDMPLVPTIDELSSPPNADHLLLTPVTERYASAVEYIDTYFRLLRADCFYALRKGLRALHDGSLDARDMNVYTNVSLKGFQATRYGNGLILVLEIKPMKPVKDWSVCSNLMFGNLLCLSPAGNFQDVIWGTVAARDVDLLKKHRWILIELCTTCNSMGDSEAIISLAHSSGRMIMVESPAYYRAFRPVLEALQNTKPETLPFQDQLVRGATVSDATPDYIDEESIQRCSYISDGLDQYQAEAWYHALRNEVACIQGPPGTGKTFIGIKLAKAILQMENRPTGPILVLTYKNHALDEFLKGILRDVTQNIVRVGGRSSDPDLANYNLNELLRENRMSRDMYGCLRELRDEIDVAKAEVRTAGRALAQSRYVSVSTLIRYMNHGQICSLVLCNPVLKVKSNAAFRLYMDRLLATLDVEEPHSDLFPILQQCFAQWCPKQAKIKDMEEDFYQSIKIDISVSENIENKEDRDEVYDEEEINRMENERVIAGTEKKIDKEELILFDAVASLSPQVRLVSTSKAFVGRLPFVRLMNKANVWSLDDADRLRLLQCLLVRQAMNCSQDLEQVLRRYEILNIRKSELEAQHKAFFLKSTDVLGMTLTGASINRDLLGSVKPAVIIVEEAAEVLEAQLIAILGDWVKHLILIGDHKQLRPAVECYELEKDFHMDLSMMERLIRCDCPFKTLNLQNRMKPEIAELLIDIYPKLESNLARVSQHSKSDAMKHYMYFWAHTDAEKGGRSYSNEKEAERAVNLALFLIQQGHEPSSITILGAYRGQVALLRRLVRKAAEKWPDLFPLILENSDEEQRSTKSDIKLGGKVERKGIEKVERKSITVSTIDLYQGDENEFVIVSLVRSNPKGITGFVKVLNRRCVAQSRAKRGMYLIGNETTLRSVKHWVTMLDAMKERGCVGHMIYLQCRDHPHVTVAAITAEDIPLEHGFCAETCIHSFECGRHKCYALCQPWHTHSRCIKPCLELFQPCFHPCPKGCFPFHEHRFCVQRIDFNCAKCGESCVRRCAEKEEDIHCQGKIQFEFPCKHLGYRKCWEDPSTKKCDEKCTKLLSCSHMCSMSCSALCNEGRCKVCEELRREAEKMKLEAEERRRVEAREEAKRELDEILQSGEQQLEVRLLANSDSTAAEFDKVARFVEKGLPKPVDRSVEVTNVAKIFFQRGKWLSSKYVLHDPCNIDWKFMEYSTTDIDQLEQDNMMLRPTSGSFQTGFYVSSHLSDIEETQNDKPQKALIVDVQLGKVMTVNASSKFDVSRLSSSKHDSLYTRTRQISGRFIGDEFAVARKDQILPLYVVSYVVKSLSTQSSAYALEREALATGGDMNKIKINPKREMDPDDPLEYHLRLAESQFHRLLKKMDAGIVYLKTGDFTFQTVDYYINPKLLRKFLNMESRMKEKYGDAKEAGHILAFHGTKTENVKNIVQDNFDMDRLSQGSGDKGWYGGGIYLSEFPQTSLYYGEALILCRVLPGKSKDLGVDEKKMGGGLFPGYDSHRVNKQEEGYGDELVIFNPDQVLPCYVINYERRIAKKKPSYKKK